MHTPDAAGWSGSLSAVSRDGRAIIMNYRRNRFVTAILLHTMTASSASLLGACTTGEDSEADRMVELEDLATDQDENERVDGDVFVLDAEPAAGPQADVELYPCGNASLDAGEQCDHGAANGPDRECTHACEYNECDLDEHGECIPPHWPAADVPLDPCTWDDCEPGVAG